MDGLIVKEPYARQLVLGHKKFEYRSTKLPKSKLGKPVYILTPKEDGYQVKGQVTFFPSNQGEETWRAIDPIAYNSLVIYNPKIGCVIWINNVVTKEIKKNCNECGTKLEIYLEGGNSRDCTQTWFCSKCKASCGEVRNG